MRRLLALCLIASAAACSGGDDAPDGVASDDTTDEIAPDTTDGIATDPAITDDQADDGATSIPDPPSDAIDTGAIPTGVDLTLVLPAPPDDPDAAGVPGETVDPARLNTDEYALWCDRSSGATVAMLTVGDVWQTGEGSGVVAEVDPLQFMSGDEEELPSAFDMLVLFAVDAHDDDTVPQEFSSVEEESSGTVVVGGVPCVGMGDELILSIDARLGAETDPGYTATMSMTGTIRISVTGPPEA